jgi:UDP-GlcNAc:undecaprenyl-phosphate GlcNAc-1-phosphate transferase
VTVVILAFVAALFFAILTTPAARTLAFKLGLIAVPRSDRAHEHPTAMMGGVAIYVGATVALLLGGIGAPVKLLSQFVAVSLPLLSGVAVRLPIPQVLNIALTVIWIIYITNAINLSDNMDGVAAGLSTVAAAFFTLVAAMNGQYLVSALGAAVMGASLGFLVFNLPLPRASIFMGDAGALFLGFMLAILGIKVRFPSNVSFVTWMVPVLVLGVPLFDPVLVFVSRFRRRVSLMQGGVDHLSHRLDRMGFGPLGATLALNLVAGSLGMTAVFVMQASLVEGYAMGTMVFLLACYALYKLEWRLAEDKRIGVPK